MNYVSLNAIYDDDVTVLLIQKHAYVFHEVMKSMCEHYTEIAIKDTFLCVITHNQINTKAKREKSKLIR